MTIDLVPFCGDCGNIKKPFAQGDFLWATNNRVLVGVPLATPCEQQAKPNILLMMDLWRDDVDWQPWPTVAIDGLSDCRECEGSGAAEVEDCPDCDGHGETRCVHCNADSQCRACGGSGEVNSGTCPQCNGKKKIVQPHHVLCGANQVAWESAELIRTLPNPQWCEALTYCLYLKFDGGRGAVATLIPATTKGN